MREDFDPSGSFALFGVFKAESHGFLVSFPLGQLFPIKCMLLILWATKQWTQLGLTSSVNSAPEEEIDCDSVVSIFGESITSEQNTRVCSDSRATRVFRHSLLFFTKIRDYSLFEEEITKWQICYSRAGRSVLGKLCPRSWIPPEAAGLGRYSRQRAQFFPIRTDLGWWITFLFFSTTQRKACERPEHFRAVMMARFATNWRSSSEQIVMKTEVIQVEERGFTERFLFT